MNRNTKQVAKQFKTTPQSVNNWIKHFGPNLSPAARRKQHRLISEADFEVLQLAKEHLDAGLTYKEVKTKLPPYVEVITNEHEPLEDFQDPEEEPQTDLQPADFFDYVNQLLSTKDDLIAELRSDKERLQEQLDYERLPWWRKWRR